MSLKSRPVLSNKYFRCLLEHRCPAKMRRAVGWLIIPLSPTLHLDSTQRVLATPAFSSDGKRIDEAVLSSLLSP